ncbi:gamma-soluble nsf attachment protein [Plakobranchus ocellatus]|uniref:Gamma-soluble nsf attachment protein n=1 Tax=Plakobranchus ocellatus TaxID=259542 RepID=A0AAV4A7W4_9GAST|nr:gamma-soluble nsf attachment protein [Plakobranchus ocellatus]
MDGLATWLGPEKVSDILAAVKDRDLWRDMFANAYNMKTSLFKWKPDTDGAVAEYTKAATAFRNAKAYEQAKESYIKVGDLQKSINSYPFAV